VYVVFLIRNRCCAITPLHDREKISRRLTTCIPCFTVGVFTVLKVECRYGILECESWLEGPAHRRVYVSAVLGVRFGVAEVAVR